MINCEKNIFRDRERRRDRDRYGDIKTDPGIKTDFDGNGDFKTDPDNFVKAEKMDD